MKPYEILLVEDNAADAQLIKDVLGWANVHFNIWISIDGEQASDYINRRGNHRDRAVPALVILDLNLPRKSGREVLKEIRALPETKDLPVVILSGSDHPDEKRACMELGANRFLIKPDDLDALEKMSMAILELLRMP